MLVLTREIGQKILINDNITIVLVDIRDTKRARIGIDAPKEIPVHRQEVWQAIKERSCTSTE